MSTQVIRLGTRSSQLAMWQSTWVARQLELGGIEVELVKIQTTGDVQTGPLAQIGGQGLFTKRLQQALLEDQIDLAVHSLKDLPTRCDPRLTIAAVPVRECPLDSLVSNTATCLDDLAPNSIIGTGSVRRAAQLKHVRSDLDIRDIRGNVDTRIGKLDDGKRNVAESLARNEAHGPNAPARILDRNDTRVLEFGFVKCKIRYLFYRGIDISNNWNLSNQVFGLVPKKPTHADG